jgi:hypothetical protein
MAASAANCKNLKANFTVDSLLCRTGDEPVRRALIDRRGCSFNPPGIAAAHNAI